jgi:hypothetical protein
VQEALQLLEKHAAGANVGINDLFGSVEAGSGALVLTGRGTAAFTEALATMETAAGATQSAYETMEQGINRQLEKLAADFNVIVPRPRRSPRPGRERLHLAGAPGDRRRDQDGDVLVR